MNRFDVFAEPESIAAKIHAIANRLMRTKAANFDRVGQAAGGLDMEIREDGMPRIGVGDDESFLTRALASLVNFVDVGCAPVVNRRQPELVI